MQITVPVGAKVWVSSDHHFGHARILEYEARPYASVEEMNAGLVRRHNALVAPTDVFIALGDLCMGEMTSSLAWASQLNGIKYLVPGNHDRVSSAHQRGKQVERFMPLYEAAGFTVLPERDATIDIDGFRFLLSHYPYTGDHTEHDRHADQRPVDTGLLLLHGHIHSLRAIDGRQFNVGVDVNDFAPVGEEQILSFARGAQ